MRILLATDGSAEARAAGEFLCALPLPPGMVIHVMTVVNDWSFAGVPPGEVFPADLSELDRWERERAHRVVEKAAAQLTRAGITVTSSVERGQPANQIILTAQKWEADLTVLGSRGLTGLERLVLGSVARNVARHAPCPVLIGRPVRYSLERVVVAVDESETARKAVDFATRLPLPPGTRIVVTHVVRPGAPLPGLVPVDPRSMQRDLEGLRRIQHRRAATLVHDAEDRLKAAGMHAAAEVREGDATHEILALVEETHADLVVAGVRGVSLIQGLLVGSVADELLREARSSVLLVR